MCESWHNQFNQFSANSIYCLFFYGQFESEVYPVPQNNNRKIQFSPLCSNNLNLFLTFWDYASFFILTSRGERKEKKYEAIRFLFIPFCFHLFNLFTSFPDYGPTYPLRRTKAKSENRLKAYKRPRKSCKTSITGPLMNIHEASVTAQSVYEVFKGRERIYVGLFSRSVSLCDFVSSQFSAVTFSIHHTLNKTVDFHHKGSSRCVGTV